MTHRKYDREGSLPASVVRVAERGKTTRRAVLVVDDERGVRECLAQELASEFEVIAVPGVEEALEVLGERSDFVAVVSDMVMRAPDDGYVLLEAVRLLLPGCVRVLVSGTAEGDWYVVRGTAHRFVRKPWEPGEVLAAVRGGGRCGAFSAWSGRIPR